MSSLCVKYTEMYLNSVSMEMLRETSNWITDFKN
jgi:hypothetical protein